MSLLASKFFPLFNGLLFNIFNYLLGIIVIEFLTLYMFILLPYCLKQYCFPDRLFLEKTYEWPVLWRSFILFMELIKPLRSRNYSGMFFLSDISIVYPLDHLLSMSNMLYFKISTELLHFLLTLPMILLVG